MSDDMVELQINLITLTLSSYFSGGFWMANFRCQIFQSILIFNIKILFDNNMKFQI